MYVCVLRSLSNYWTSQLRNCKNLCVQYAIIMGHPCRSRARVTQTVRWSLEPGIALSSNVDLFLYIGHWFYVIGIASDWFSYM